MEYNDKIDFESANAALLSLSFTEYSARFVLDEVEDEIPDGGIEVDIEPQIRLRWAFNSEVQQVMIKAALKLETQIVDIRTEIRAEYDTSELQLNAGEAGLEKLHEFVVLAADRDLHPAIRLAVQELSMKVMHTPLLLPIANPFSEGARNR